MTPYMFNALLQSFQSAYTAGKRREAGTRQANMMLVKITAFALALSIASIGTLSASEIYKWTDEEGIVNFFDRPSGAAGEEQLAIRSRPTDPARVQAEVQTEADAQTLRAEANAAQGLAPEELLADARERQEQCNKYTERQVQFTNNRRIYRMDENGERVYYDEEEMAAARSNVDGLVERFCD
jgi:hypothetical protein